jgi:hypothetical protein
MAPFHDVTSSMVDRTLAGLERWREDRNLLTTVPELRPDGDMALAVAECPSPHYLCIAAIDPGHCAENQDRRQSSVEIVGARK